MVTRDQLKAGGLRAYEQGRVRTALRVAWFLVPVSLLCALETGAGETCACVGTLLLGAALYLRWRDRRGVNAVSAGLVAGSLPLVVGLALARLSPTCANAPLWSLCTAICLTVGVPSGIWLGVRAARGSFGMAGALTATGIAALAASLGCAELGVAGIVGAAAGLALGAAATVLPAPANH
jgi:hypothetical protein